MILDAEGQMRTARQTAIIFRLFFIVFAFFFLAIMAFTTFFSGTLSRTASTIISVSILVAEGLCMYWIFVAQTRQLKSLERKKFLVCPGCAYSLENIGEKWVCPECGRPFDDADLRGAWSRAFIGRTS